MSIAAHYPGDKVADEIRECHGCHLKVMAKGDQSGWKGVDGGGGNLRWFCEKTACQQLREEFVAQRSQEMFAAQQRALEPTQRPVETLSDEETDQEEQRLKARLMAIEARKRQSSAEEPEQKMAPMITPEEEKQQVREQLDGTANDSGLYEGVQVHQTKDGVSSLCGEEGAIFAVGEDLPDNCVPCVQCAEELESPAQQADEPDEPIKGIEVDEDTVGVYNPEGGVVGQVPVSEVKPTPPEVLDEAPAGAVQSMSKPAPPIDLDKLPRFTPELIEEVASEGYSGHHILIPPSAYPDMNMEGTDPERFRDGVTKLFAKTGLAVDTIKRARKGEEFVGVVFTLKKVAEK